MIPRIKYGFRALLLVLLASVQLLACASAERRGVPAVHVVTGAPATVSAADAASPGVLRVMTLNMAHSRGDGFHQLLQSTASAHANLRAMLALFERYDPDVVALQEADRNSFWNGNFDHVEYVARHGDFQQFVHGEHVQGGGLSYGTALISKLTLKNPEPLTFDPTTSITPKGFVVSTVRWPGASAIQVDMVSVHLDFFSESNRRRQAAELIQVLRQRQRPLIVMGDLNAEWIPGDSTVRHLARALNLKPYRPVSEGLDTFPGFGKRLDWILVSPHFVFLDHRVLPDSVSDHRPVIATLGIKPYQSVNTFSLAWPGMD